MWAALFFLISSIMGFFGGGLIAFMIAFILTFFKPRIISIIKFFFVTLFSLVAAYYVLALVKPNVLAYNISNIKKVFQYDMPTGARKVMAFRNYGVAYSSNVKDFLLGSGPGTFNSRSAFMIGSPSYFTSVSFIKSPNQPYYFKHYAYPLWNEHNTSQALYQDGFRNQPFSSLLSFLGEYGFLFTFFFLLYYYKSYKQIRWTGRNNQSPGFAAYEKLLKFLYIFLAMLFCIDNFFEYAETTLLIVSVIKLIHIHFVNSSPMQEPELVT
ncbi:hypothetical protein [Paraflavitalea sp. CAU 1676]|uniref:hypothetical protein n=1 Tax=Paraflavitalea sp. CAU 1676 TaxID=3032598 RepID=UPI0023DC51C9|nr:hypothetical protein [Paraflavitalea sp. CAU 1676]MDF2187460.1 hypothetical protein [Paraflavitalea sp. CAU 1676]